MQEKERYAIGYKGIGIFDILNQQDKEIRQLKQSQKQLAIKELEKVKNYFDDKECDDESDGWIITNRNVVEYVDNQIKSLKGEE